WRPLRKGALRGFAVIELPIGLRISDVAIFSSNDQAWATLPAKPQISKDGQHKTAANGKPYYSTILEWRSRALSDRFSEAVIAAIRQLYPGTLDEASP